MKRMFELRTIYPALNDGFLLECLSNKTYDIYLPGSEGTPTETGLWSVLRSRADIQDFTGQGQGNQSVWLVYGNENVTTTYTFNCTNISDALIAPFDAGLTVKNLFYPYEEHTLEPSTQFFGFENSNKPNGCLKELKMLGWGFKAFVPKSKWVGAAPSITGFLPGHDYRMLSTVKPDEKESVGIQIQFSQNMDCDMVTESITIVSNTNDHSVPTIDGKSVSCLSINAHEDSRLSGGVATAWTYSANLVNVANGVHTVIIKNATDASRNSSTGVVDNFMFRIGQAENPMIFPRQANYSESLLFKQDDGSLKVSHKAAGATKFRYSVDFQSSFSDWSLYTGEDTILEKKNWTGTDAQAWKGDHVYVQYWCDLCSSSNHFQHGDLGNDGIPRRIPHMYIQGPFNQYSYDAGVPGDMKQYSNGTWYYDFVSH
jgi:alpha-1,3-glucan synthase